MKIRVLFSSLSLQGIRNCSRIRANAWHGSEGTSIWTSLCPEYLCMMVMNLTVTVRLSADFLLFVLVMIKHEIPAFSSKNNRLQEHFSSIPYFTSQEKRFYPSPHHGFEPCFYFWLSSLPFFIQKEVSLSRRRSPSSPSG